MSQNALFVCIFTNKGTSYVDIEHLFQKVVNLHKLYDKRIHMAAILASFSWLRSCHYDPSNSFQIKWFSFQTPRKDEYSLLNFYLSELKTNARARFLTTKDHFGPADTDRSIPFLIDDYWPANRSIFH